MGTVTQRYSMPLEIVFARLVDPAHLRARAEAMGDGRVRVQGEQRDYGFILRVERDVQLEVPPFAQRVLAPVNRVIDRLHWRVVGDERHGTRETVISPTISVRSRLQLTPVGGGCVYTDTFGTEVDIPNLHKKVAALIARHAEDAVTAELRYTARELGA